MNRTLISLCMLLLSVSPVFAEGSDCRTWYAQPASRWVDAMPLGNGRLGAMVFGGVAAERLQLNEESLWAGEPIDTYPDDFAENLKGLQKLVLEGKVAEAREFGLEKLTMSPTSFRSYEPLADLWIEMDHGDEALDYRRELDLQNGIARVQYRIGNTVRRRELLISAVDDVMAVRLSTDTPGTLSARVSLTRQKDIRVTPAGSDRLHMDGQIVDIAAPEAREITRADQAPAVRT